MIKSNKIKRIYKYTRSKETRKTKIKMLLFFLIF